MRLEDDDGIRYACDVCHVEERGRAYEVKPNQWQWIQPVGWFVLDVRHDQGANSPRLKAHTCSLECAVEQLRAWERGRAVVR